MDIEKIRLFREKLRQLERVLGWQFGWQTECCGITLPQCHVLLEVGKKGGVSLVELAEGLGLDTSTLSRTINGMVNIGLVNRHLNPEDRRFVSITLTKQGKALSKSIENLSNRYFQTVFELIPKAKQREVVESFFLLSDAIRKQAESDRSLRGQKIDNRPEEVHEKED